MLDPAAETPDPYGLTSAHWEALETVAVLHGWVASKEAGMVKSSVSDAIAVAAAEAIKERLLLWHSQDPERHPATLPKTQSDGEE